MTLESMSDQIRYFKSEVIESGFKRDIDDYLGSLPSHQTNIITLRDIANKVLDVLDHIYHSDLPDSLNALLPIKGREPFTATSHYEIFKEQLEDTQIELAAFFNKISTNLTNLKTQIDKDIAEINIIDDFINPYISVEVNNITEENSAIVAIIFKEKNTITSLAKFTKTLSKWNRTLPVYHQLLKSESPEDIEIIEVQNGSIDFVVNINVDVALDLAKLFKIGFEVFGAYLIYKHSAKPIIDTYHGNKELIDLEERKEKLLLGNIGIAIANEINAQHKKAKKIDAKIDGTALKTKVAEVTKLIASHIVKGNDLKLLALPEQEEQEELEEGQIPLPDPIVTLREKSMAARQQLRFINPEDQQILLTTYGNNEEEPG